MKNRLRLTIGKRLGLAFGMTALIVLALGLAGYYGTLRSSQSIEEIGRNRLPSVQALLIISEAQTAINSAENALLSTYLDAQGREGLKEGGSRWAAAMHQFLLDLQ